MASPLIWGPQGALNLQTALTINQNSSKIDQLNDQLIDQSTNLALDWQNRLLKYTGGSTTSIDWQNGILDDNSSNQSVNWNSRLLRSSSTAASVAWNARQLFALDGSTVNLDWSAIGTVELTSAVLNMNSHKINNLASPSISTDAANKSYVDSAYSADGTTLQLISGVFSIKNSGVGTTQLANNSVTYAKLQTETATTLLGNPTGSLAVPSEITLGSTLTFSGSALQTLALTGDVTTSANSFSTSVAKIQGVSVGTPTGTGNVVFSSGPTLVNPIVGTQSTTDNSTKAASTAYVTTAVANAVAGVNPAVAVQAATTSASNTSGFAYNNGVSGIGATFTGTANTAVTIDGFTFTTTGQRLLVKNDTQSPSGAFNGVYFVTQIQTLTLPPIFTRALDYDQASDINNTGAIPVVNGTVNGTTSWLLTSSVTNVGVDPLTYIQFSINPSTVMTNPMTTTGDTIYGGSGGTPTRLPIGTAGQILTVASGIPGWSSTAAAAPAYSYVSQSSTLNPAAISSYYILSGASFTITLPDSTTTGYKGQSIIFQHNGTSLTQVYTFNTTSSQTINGPGGTVSSGNYALYTNGETIQIISDGANWQVVEHRTETGWVSAGTTNITAASAFVFTLGTTHSATIGAVYSDGTNNFTVSATIAGVSSLTCSGYATPAASGTLTKVSGTGDSSIAYTSRTTTGQPIKGTVSNDLVQWRRRGRFAIVNYQYIQTATGSGTIGSGDYIFQLPLTLDTGVITPYLTATGTAIWNSTVTGQAIAQLPGDGSSTSATNTLDVYFYAYTSTQFRVSGPYNSTGSVNQDPSHIPVGSSNAQWNYTMEIPILGWQP